MSGEPAAACVLDRPHDSQPPARPPLRPQHPHSVAFVPRPVPHTQRRPLHSSSLQDLSLRLLYGLVYLQL